MPKSVAIPKITRARRSTAGGFVPPEDVVEFLFPIKGIDESQPRSKMDRLNCTNALNVRPFPPFSDRLGGGKRPGTRRAFTNATVASAGLANRVIGLDCQSAPPSSPVALPVQVYIYPTADQTGYPLPPLSWYKETNVNTNTFQSIDEVHGSADDADYARTQPKMIGQFNPQTGLWEAKHRWNCGAGSAVPVANSGVILYLRFRIVSGGGITPPGSGPGGGHGSFENTAGGVTVVGSQDTSSGDPITADVDTATIGGAQAIQEETVDVGTLDSGDGNGYARFRFALLYDHDGLGDWRSLGGGDYEYTAIDDNWVDAQILNTALASVPAGVWTNANRLAVQCIAGENGGFNGLFMDISYAHVGWQASGTVPTPQGVVPDKVLILLPNKVYVADIDTDALNTATDATLLVKQYPSIAFFNTNWYVVDGGDEKIISQANPPVVTDWSGAVTGGTLPTAPTLVSTYRNRMVLAAGTNWYMSAIGDPLDWAFAADTDKPGELSAVAGTNRFIGKPSDNITALIPWSDDQFVFGCATTIWAMEGDPGWGGSLRNLTQQTGILGGRAWCFDEFGNLWFVGSSGLYRLQRDGKLENVSGRRMYRRLDRLDANANMIQLAYDAFSKTVHVFVTPLSASAESGESGDGTFNEQRWLHFTYDITTDSFWFDDYPVRFGPWAVCRLTGSTDDDRRFLMGGDDGHIRRPFDGGKLTSAGLFSPTGTARYGTGDDMKRDGTAIAGFTAAIESSVRFPPVEAPFADYELIATEIVGYGTDNNLPLALPLSSVSGYWLTHNSAARVSELPVVVNAQAAWFWFGENNYGQQLPIGLRIAGGAHQLVIRHHSSTHSWAMDRAIGKFVRGSRRR